MPRVTLQAGVTKVTADVPFNGTEVDISAMEKPIVLQVNVTALTADKVARFEIQSSVDNFTNITRHKVLACKGPFTKDTPYSFPPLHDYDLLGLPAGTASAEVRVTLAGMDAAASVTYNAQLTYGE